VNIQPGVKAGDEAPSPDYSIHPTATIAMSTKPGSFRFVRQLVSLVLLAA
jgi:hypothetical protein